MGELLTIWSVRLAVGFYLGRYLLEFTVPDDRRRRKISLWFWTCGCLLYLLHVVCAFAFFHSWSHTLAYEQTAAQTRDVVGLDWGGGLYFNYIFTAVWIADVVRRRRYDDARPQRRWRIAAELFMAFMVVNATVVFGPPFWKWIGAVLALTISLLYGYRRQGGR